MIYLCYLVGESFRTGLKDPVKVVNNETNKGLAETLRIGLLGAIKLAAKQDIIITMDADNTHPAGLVSRIVRWVREGSSLLRTSLPT